MGRIINIIVKDYVKEVYSNDDGLIIYNALKKELNSANHVRVSFKEIYALNTSFVNSAFIELLNDFEFEYIKEHVHFIDSTKQINSIIKDRFLFEINEREHTFPNVK